jgi:hypothetical protein
MSSGMRGIRRGPLRERLHLRCREGSEVLLRGGDLGRRGMWRRRWGSTGGPVRARLHPPGGGHRPPGTGTGGPAGPAEGGATEGEGGGHGGPQDRGARMGIARERVARPRGRRTSSRRERGDGPEGTEGSAEGAPWRAPGAAAGDPGRTGPQGPRGGTRGSGPPEHRHGVGQVPGDHPHPPHRHPDLPGPDLRHHLGLHGGHPPGGGLPHGEPAGHGGPHPRDRTSGPRATARPASTRWWSSIRPTRTT